MAKAGRLYLQLDVNYHEDARLVDVSPLAELLYIRCLCACKRLATDGSLSNTQIARIGADICFRRGKQRIICRGERIIIVHGGVVRRIDH